MFLLLEAALNTPTMSIPTNQSLDHVDEFLSVHLLTVGVTGGHVGMVRFEHHSFAGVYFPVLCLRTIF